MATILSLVSLEERTTLAADMIADLSAPFNNVYLGIGQSAAWPANDTLVTSPIETTDALNSVWRNMCALALIEVSDASLVINRVDWANGTVYNMYSNSTQMFSYTKIEQGNGTCNVANSTTVNGVNTTFLLDFSNNEFLTLQGDGILLMPQTKEIVNIVSNTQLIVNSAFTGNFVSNIPFETTNTYPNYAQNFYVRNIYDQVFVCLFNNSGGQSTIMPAISIGGQLPSSQYIVTADGYFWKYMYTIPSGLKQSFFNTSWMPVVIDTNVLNSAVSGRLDVIEIISGGSGYNNGAATFSAPILTVVGDGFGANLTAQVGSNGTIIGINILNPGQNYTFATIAVTPSPNANGANLQVIIGPNGGWGSNAAVELGAHTVMFSIPLAGNVSGTLPIGDALGDTFKYRQLYLVQSPTLNSNVAANANGSNYDMTTIINVSSNTPFAMNDLVFQSGNGAYAGATWTANVVWFDVRTNNLHVNNPVGVFVGQQAVYGTKSANSSPYASVTAFSLTPPLVQPFTGQILYVENRSAVSRANNQTENINLIIGF